VTNKEIRSIHEFELAELVDANAEIQELIAKRSDRRLTFLRAQIRLDGMSGRTPAARLSALLLPLSLLPLVFAVSASPAAAKVPKFDYSKPSIVPGESIGGVSVGMSKAKAKAVWGAPDECFTYRGVTRCQYTVPSPLPGPAPVAAFEVKGGKIVSVEIETQEDQEAVAKLNRLETVKGIDLGSLMATARSKYGIPLTGAGEANLSHASLKRDKRCTQFYAPTEPYKTIEDIDVGVCGTNGLLAF
jgi:hypothetical protein